MKTVALLVALVVAAVGFTGVVAPDLLLTIGRHLVTPAGMYVIGAMRVAVGILLLITAQSSRAPRALRVIGAIVIVAGLVTPWFGAERASAILDWESQRSLYLRVEAALLVGLGVWLAFVIGSGPSTRLGGRVS